MGNKIFQERKIGTERAFSLSGKLVHNQTIDYVGPIKFELT